MINFDGYSNNIEISPVNIEYLYINFIIGTKSHNGEVHEFISKYK